jgi:hypothetical protein
VSAIQRLALTLARVVSRSHAPGEAARFGCYRLVHSKPLQQLFSLLYSLDSSSLLTRLASLQAQAEPGSWTSNHCKVNITARRNHRPASS